MGKGATPLVVKKMRERGLLVFRTKMREKCGGRVLPRIDLIVFVEGEPVFVHVDRYRLRSNVFQVKQVPCLPGDYVVFDASERGLSMFFSYVERKRQEALAKGRLVLEGLAEKSRLTERDVWELDDAVKRGEVEWLRGRGLV
jgi:hypothetical protein